MIEKRREAFRQGADKECLHRILKSISENIKEFDSVFRDLTVSELRKNPQDISDLPFWLAENVIDKWESENAAKGGSNGE